MPGYLFMGTLPVDFGSIYNAVTSGGDFDTDYVPGGLRLRGSNAVTQTIRSSAVFKPSLDVWFHFRLTDPTAPSGMGGQSPTASVNLNNLVVSFNSGGFPVAGLHRNAAASGYYLRVVGTASPASPSIPAATFSGVGREAYDFHVFYDSGDIVAELYKANVLIGSVRTPIAVPQAIDSISFTGMNGLGTNQERGVMSEVIITDGISTLGKRLSVAVPASAGAENTLASGTWAELVAGDPGTPAIADAPGQRILWAPPALTQPPLAASIVNVSVVSRAVSPGSGLDLAPLVRIGSANYAAAAQEVTGVAVVAGWDLNPVTGLPWERAEIASAQFGFQAA